MYIIQFHLYALHRVLSRPHNLIPASLIFLKKSANSFFGIAINWGVTFSFILSMIWNLVLLKIVLALIKAKSHRQLIMGSRGAAISLWWSVLWKNFVKGTKMSCHILIMKQQSVIVCPQLQPFFSYSISQVAWTVM